MQQMIMELKKQNQQKLFPVRSLICNENSCQFYPLPQLGCR